MFIPHPKKAEIEPFQDGKIIASDKPSLIQSGRVLKIGTEVTRFKEGDIIFFEGWGCSETAPDPEGKTHWVVWDDEKVILGTYEQ